LNRIPALILLLALGCGNVASPPPPADPITLTDIAGRTVTIPSNPRRIVSSAPACTEILFAVGAGDAVVGVTELCNYPPEAATRAKIGQFGPETISLETVLGLRPDLVFAAPGTQDPFIDALSRHHIPVVAVEARSFAEVYRAVELVGTATGHAERGKDLAAELNKRVDAVAARPIAKRPRVFYLLDASGPLVTAGPKTFIGEMVRLAGGDNVFDDVTQLYPAVTDEELVRRDPEVVVVPKGKGHEIDIHSIMARPAWKTITAAKNRRVIELDQDAASRAGPRLADALEQLADALRK
jgi:iron complex transport system substrate-binding protein